MFFYLSFKKKKVTARARGKRASPEFYAKDDYTFSLKYTPRLFIANPQFKLPCVGVRGYREGLFLEKIYLWGLLQNHNSNLGWKRLWEVICSHTRAQRRDVF